MKLVLLAAAGLALTLSACSRGDETAPEPQGESVGAAMPDTSAPPQNNQLQTAPNAGDTGTVPADGSAPPVAQTPAVGTAGGEPGAAPATPTPQ